MKKMAKLNIIVMKTIKKELMCGDVGFGAMQEPIEIAKFVENVWQFSLTI